MHHCVGGYDKRMYERAGPEIFALAHPARGKRLRRLQLSARKMRRGEILLQEKSKI